jgi:hypothetical protein
MPQPEAQLPFAHGIKQFTFADVAGMSVLPLVVPPPPPPVLPEA